MPEVLQQYVYVGKDQKQEVKIKCVADVAGSLAGKYFLFHDPSGAKHYAWYDNGVATDPAPVGGWTGHAVTIANGDSATAVASATQSVLDAVTGFDCTVSGVELTLKCTANGYCQPARDTEDSLKKTGFSFAVTVLGMVEESIGCIQGDIELSPFNYTTLEVKCHASGTTVVQEIVTGIENPELSFTLQDTSKEKIEKIFNLIGNASQTAVGADKSKVFGFGTALIGNTKPFIPLRTHPVKLDASDKSYDWNIWKTNISMESFVFAAEDVATIPVKCKAFADETKSKAHNVIMIGNPADAITV